MGDYKIQGGSQIWLKRIEVFIGHPAKLEYCIVIVVPFVNDDLDEPSQSIVATFMCFKA